MIGSANIFKVIYDIFFDLQPYLYFDKYLTFYLSKIKDR